jgi:hypothetical protein
MPFNVESFYTRDEIHDALGGDIQSFLPEKNGQIVCACLADDIDPPGRQVMLIDDGPDYQRGEILSEQAGSIPVFLQEGIEWEYLGEYEVEKVSTDLVVIDHFEPFVAGRFEVCMVIFLRKASSGHWLH